MIAAIVWTVIFVGGDLAVMVVLLWYAFRKDRQRLQQAADE